MIENEVSKINYIGKLNEWISRYDDLTLMFTFESSGPLHELQYICHCELFRTSGSCGEDHSPGIKFTGESSTKQEAKTRACGEMLAFVLTDMFNKEHAKVLNYVPLDEKLKKVKNDTIADSQIPPTVNPVCFINEFIQAHPSQGFTVKFEFPPIFGPAHSPTISCHCTFSNPSGILYQESACGKNKSEAKTNVSNQIRNLILNDKTSLLKVS